MVRSSLGCDSCKHRTDNESVSVCWGCTSKRLNYTPEDKEMLINGKVVAHSSVDVVLEERGSRYGDFKYNALITQQCEEIFKDHAPHYWSLKPIQREALHMIIQKLSRAACGDSTYVDNWVDICGYAQCVVNFLDADWERRLLSGE
jgi:hypothetical protein